jgi:transcriptional regulator with XRE-family HTH domain
MSPTSHSRPPAPAAVRALNRLAVSAGRAALAERRRRGWSGKVVAGRAGISIGYLSELEGGAPVSLETYARVFTALDLPLDLRADGRDRVTTSPGQDFVHAAMGDLEAQRLRRFGLSVAIDEPYQHYQFAGRADIVAWDLEARALLHIENRTRFPNIQHALGSFGSKRAYLGAVLAERLGLGRFGWLSETHVLAGLWSGELMRDVRARETTFRVACPDGLAALDRWWAGTVRLMTASPTGARSRLPRSSTLFVLMDPAPGVREAFRFASLERLDGRPRYADYASAARALGARPRHPSAIGNEVEPVGKENARENPITRCSSPMQARVRITRCSGPLEQREL